MECNTNMGVPAADLIGMLKGYFAQSDTFRYSEYNDYNTRKSALTNNVQNVTEQLQQLVIM